MKNIDDKILEDIKNDTDNIQIPESLSPDNMMAKIAKKKEEGYFAVEENKEKNSGKKNNTKLAALLSSSRWRYCAHRRLYCRTPGTC